MVDSQGLLNEYKAIISFTCFMTSIIPEFQPLAYLLIHYNNKQQAHET
jgi:hypothetical protein